MVVQYKQPSLVMEIIVRIFLVAFFFYTDKAKPLFRKIQPEEFWLYRFPRTPSYYPSPYLWATLAVTPPLVIGVFYYIKKDLQDLRQGLLGAILSIFLAGSFVNIVKIGVGRPRPDFLARCFPHGNVKLSMECEGDYDHVIDGYKSFPSGHSALSFSCLAYLSLYIAGKLHCFSPAGRGNSSRLIAAVLPLVWATMIAVSRTIDYHHHWQDVTVGSIIGISVAYLCYRQYYPSIQRTNSHLPYISISHVDTEINYTDHPITPRSPNHDDRVVQMMKTV